MLQNLGMKIKLDLITFNLLIMLLNFKKNQSSASLLFNYESNEKLHGMTEISIQEYFFKKKKNFFILKF